MQEGCKEVVSLAAELPGASRPLSRLRASLPRRRGARARVAQAVLADPGRIVAADMTAQKVAREAGASESAVVRLAQYLGYSGFPEFKLALMAELPRSPLALPGNIAWRCLRSSSPWEDCRSGKASPCSSRAG